MKIIYPSIISIISILLIGSCTYVQKINTGTMAYERKQFKVATSMLKSEFSKEKSRIEKGKLAYMLGESYKNLNENADAIEWYKMAYDNSYGIDALKEYAFGLKKSERYKEAQTAFKELGIEIGSPYEYRKEISACKIAQEWLDSGKKSGYTIDNIELNSDYSDYAPTLYEDGQLVFTSDRGASVGDESYNWTGNNFSDIFVADADLSSVNSFDNIINTENNEGTATFNADFTEMVFTRCYGGEKTDHYCKLMMSSKDGNAWTEPQVLDFTKEEVIYGHPALSADGSTLYFSSNDPDGWGGFDIWIAYRTPEGWSEEPKLLSRSINTIGDEKFPYLDNDTLYFSSNKHTGMGGLDIFKTYKMDEENWAPAYNLKAPINSGADDFGYVVDRTKRKNKKILQRGYFTSTRFDGKGSDDIYRFEKRMPPPPPPPPPVDTTENIPPPPPIVYKMILEGYVVEKIFSDPNNPNSKMLGRRPLGGSKVDVMIGDEKKTIELGEDGFFTFEMDTNTDYYFFASKADYLNNNTRFSTKGIAKDPANPIQKFEVEILLDKIFKNREIVLENIYYDFNESYIRQDAQPTLNKLAELLQRNPEIKIELASHTDCIGAAGYNQKLSQDRAQAAVDFLIKKGIQAERVSARGYGKNSPAIDCICQRCTDEERQINRRTAFKVLD